MSSDQPKAAGLFYWKALAALGVLLAGAAVVWVAFDPLKWRASAFNPRTNIETSGLAPLIAHLKPWPTNASLEEIAAAWKAVTPAGIAAMDQQLRDPRVGGEMR